MTAQVRLEKLETDPAVGSVLPGHLHAMHDNRPPYMSNHALSEGVWWFDVVSVGPAPPARNVDATTTAEVMSTSQGGIFRRRRGFQYLLRLTDVFPGYAQPWTPARNGEYVFEIAIWPASGGGDTKRYTVRTQPPDGRLEMDLQ